MRGDQCCGTRSDGTAIATPKHQRKDDETGLREFILCVGNENIFSVLLCLCCSMYSSGRIYGITIQNFLQLEILGFFLSFLMMVLIFCS